MNRMNLGKDGDLTGRERPGMIPLYLVELSKDQFYVREGMESPVVTDSWTRAKLFTSYNGLLDAKELARRYNGKVCIVNCTPVEEYCNSTKRY